MRTGNRFALIVSVFVLVGSSVTSVAESGSARATSVGPDLAARAHGAPIRQTSSVTLSGTLYFRADDGIHGFELWKSDGTQAGTVMVRDIWPGPHGSGFDDYGDATEVGGTLYFVASDGSHGRELWKSDGTRAGTVMVRDIWPGPHGSGSRCSSPSLTDVGGTLFFAASDASHGCELWKSDGTRAGTVMVQDILPGRRGSAPASLTDFNGTLFFSAWDIAHGSELWRSDGTSAGTVLVTGMKPDMSLSPWSKLTDVEGTLYFSVYDATHNAYKIWKSDGTAAGTVLVRSMPRRSCPPEQLTDVGGTLYFNASDKVHGEELWKSDGTSAGTVLVKDIWPGHPLAFDDPCQYGPQGLTDMGGTLYFFTDDGTYGDELWKSDGTEAGTVMVKDIDPGSATSFPDRLTNVEGMLYFTATDGTHGYELWKSDGTYAGTAMVRDINPSAEVSNPFYFPSELTDVGGTLYFTPDDGTHGPELWKSDGTDAGTLIVRDINTGSQGSYPFDLVYADAVVDVPEMAAG
jgi:ELWxxDGT repeat protein